MSHTLNYHRCHSESCPAGHAAKSFTSQPEERKKSWARCSCPIVANGTLGGVHKRKATKQTNWESAAAIMAPFIQANSWEAAPYLPLPPEPPAPLPERTTPGRLMSDASVAYLAVHKEEESAEGTLTDKRQQAKRLLEFCGKKGVVTVNQFTSDLAKEYLQRFKSNAASSKATRLSSLRAFFNRLIAEKTWGITENPVELPLKIKNRANAMRKSAQQKFAFSDDDLVSMYRACREYDFHVRKKGTMGREVVQATQRVYRKWTGQDLMDFIIVSIYTGLRISDVATFHISRLVGERRIHVRTQKGGTMVYTSVPQWVADRIRARAEEVGPDIFGSHASTKLCVITNEWRKRLITLWKLCGPWDTKPTPHRFRHTFARILLQDDFSPFEVAQLLGNTEAVVLKYYAGMVEERQKRLAAKLDKSFAGVPNPFLPFDNVVPIKSA